MNIFKQAIRFALICAIASVSASEVRAATCGDFDNSGVVSATDSLGVLSTAVGASSCTLEACDVDGNGLIAATDALAVLDYAVGGPTVFRCPGVALTTLDRLPRATSPVVADGAESSFLFGGELGSAVSPGILLGEMDDSTFDENSSMAACQIASMTRTTLRAAAEADKVLCYIQNAFADLELDGIDIYDGDYHTFQLNLTDAMPMYNEYFNAPAVVRMRFDRSGDSIKEVELFTCNYASSGLRQNEYIRQTIDGSGFVMVAKGVSEDDWGGGRFAHQIRVGADLNALGQLVGTKTIATSHGSEWLDGANYGQTTVAQSAVLGSAIDSLAVDGYDGGRYSDGQNSWEYTNRVTAVAETLDLNVAGEDYDVERIALGDGAAKLGMSNATDYTWSSYTEVQAWDGDSTELDFEGSSQFVDAVIGADLTEMSGVPEIFFSASESYDCDIRPEAVIDVNMMDLNGACSQFDVSHEWFDCNNAIYGGGGDWEPEPCEGPDCTCWAAESCGGQAPAGCYCDWECAWYGDCCYDACDMCGSCDDSPCVGDECNADGVDPTTADNDPASSDDTDGYGCLDPACACAATDSTCIEECRTDDCDNQ